MPETWRGYTGLAIAALFAALVLVTAVPIVQRVVYYVLNTLIIFTVAMGAITTVERAPERGTGPVPTTAREAPPASAEPRSTGFFAPWYF